MRIDLDDLDETASAAVRRGLSNAELLVWADGLEPGGEVSRAELLCTLGQFLGFDDEDDRAEELYRAAVEDGGFAPPDARLYLAAGLLKLGRREEALAFMDAARRDNPTEPTVYEFAAENLEMAGDLRGALTWFTTGYTRCTEAQTAGPGSVVALLSGRRRVRTAMNQPEDELDELATQLRERVRSGSRRGASGPVIQMFLPAEHWDNWPESPRSGITWAEQLALIEHDLRLASSPVTRVVCVPIDPEGVAAHAALFGLEPSSEDARSSYAERLVLEGRGRSWPPGRNDPCWCGSDRKYKKCCGRPLPV